MTSSVEECALRARSTHGMPHAIVEVNIVIGVVLGEVLVARVVPLVVDAVIGLTLSLIAHVVIVVFVVAIDRRIFQNGRNTPNSVRTPGSQTPGVPATSSPRQPTTVGHRGLSLGLDVRRDGGRKMPQTAAKTPLRRTQRALLMN